MCDYMIETKDCMLQVYVRGNRQSETAILFLHGGPGSGAKPLMKLPSFQSFYKDYCCIYFDQRGSGLSLYDLKKGIVKEDIVNDVLSVAKDIKGRFHFNKIFLWGGSFGGFVASLCIQTSAESFDGFILSSPAITFSRKQALDFFNRTSSSYQRKLNNSIDNDDLTPEKILNNSKLRDFVFSERNPSLSLRHICAMSNWFYLYSFDSLFDHLNLPILILQGKDDSICDYKNIDSYLAKHHNPYLQYCLFNDCGHEVFTDKKDEFISIIEKFIRRNVKC